MVYEYEDMEFDFKNELKYELPEGYHFVAPEDIDIIKLARLCWYGFDHGDKGDFVGWDKEDCSFDWTPQKSYKGCIGSWMSPPPHSTPEYNIVIADEKEDYACFFTKCPA